MILIVVGYAAAIIACAGLALLFVANILRMSNSYGSESEDHSCMKRFKCMDVDQRPRL
ncbi:MAG: hypothetical protein J6Y58_04665 [Clostridiales bacterium]|nr:hypothetical protein [Clostridiales bacterium]